MQFPRVGRSVEVKVTSVESEPAEAGKKPDIRREVIGTTTLSCDSVAGLDRLMDYYRKRAKRGDCTTTNHVEVQQKSGGRVVSSATFVDSSGGEPARATTLDEVVALVEAARRGK